MQAERTISRNRRCPYDLHFGCCIVAENVDRLWRVVWLTCLGLGCVCVYWLTAAFSTLDILHHFTTLRLFFLPVDVLLWQAIWHEVDQIWAAQCLHWKPSQKLCKHLTRFPTGVLWATWNDQGDVYSSRGWAHCTEAVSERSPSHLRRNIVAFFLSFCVLELAQIKAYGTQDGISHTAHAVGGIVGGLAALCGLTHKWQQT